MDYNFLKVEKEGGITILKISAPKSLNALNSTILKELAHFVDNLDISTRVLIITGDGEKSFVAGADISEIELAMACDIRIASVKAKFGQPEVGLGIIPGFSGTYRLAKLIGQGYAKEMIYTGKVIRADEALRIGLVNATYEPEQLMPAAMEMAQKMLANAPVAISLAKQSINENYDLDAEASLELENKLFGKCFATRDQKEGMAAFLEKRHANFTGE